MTQPVTLTSPDHARCPHCHGGRTVLTIMPGQGITRGTCPTCLGDGQRRAFPKVDQRTELLYQGQDDAVVEAYEVNGCMAVPGEEGVTYVTRRAAMVFFGLFSAATEATARIAELEADIIIATKLQERHDKVMEAMPGCPEGEPWVPHAVGWITAAKARNTHDALPRLRDVLEYLQGGRVGAARDLIAILVQEMES